MKGLVGLGKTLHIFSSGELCRKDNTIFFESESGDKRYIPVEDTDEIFVFGEVTVNKRLLEFLSQKEVLLHYFSHYGYYMGTFYPREHICSGYMVLKQAEFYMDPKKRQDIACKFVQGAAKNMIQVLRYYHRRGKDLSGPLALIEEFIMRLGETSEVDELMAIEGNIRNSYYKSFDTIVSDPTFEFAQRTRRPPRNCMNTLISFGNSVLYTMILSEIYKTHLDPRIGFLHAANFRRFSLNLDIAEVFKPVIVDRAIFTLIHRKQITADNFETGTGGTMLTEAGRKAFISELNSKLETTLHHKDIGREVSYRRLLRLELYKLEKHLMGEKEYAPFIAEW